MTWTLKAKGTNNNGTSGDVRASLTLTLDASIAIGDTVCVAATYSDGPTGAAITDSLGNTYTQVTNTDDSGNGQRLSTFRCLVTNAGTPTLTLRFTPTPGTTTADFMSFNAEGFSGSDATSTVDGTGAAQVQSAPTTSTDATTSGTFSTATDGDLIYTATLESATGNNPGAVGTGFTALQTSGGVILKTAFKTQSTHGSVAGTWTAAANAAHVTAALASTPPAASGTTLTPTAVSSSWVVPTATLVGGPLVPTAISRAWVVPTAVLLAGALTLSPTATSRAWAVPTATLSTPTTGYSTTFATNEDPISEGSKWILGQTDGGQWGDVKVLGGKAFGKRARDYGDNTALLKGTWSADQYAEAVVWKGTVDESYFPEVELRLRSTITPNVNSGYEIGWSCRAGGAAYFFVARWNGPYDDYAYITNQVSAAHEIANGDVVRAELRGSALVVYRNGVQVFSIADVTKNDGGTFVGALYTSGAPGFGTNENTGGDAFLDQHGLTSFAAGSLDNTNLSATAVARAWTVPTATLSAGALTLSTTAPHSTWTAPVAALGAGALSLAPTATSRTWTVPTAALSAGAVTMVATAAASSWVVNAGSFGANVTFMPTAVVSTWVVPTATINVGAIALTPAAVMRTWTTPAAAMGVGAATMPATATVRTWAVPSATLGEVSATVHLDAPLSIDFISRAKAIGFLDGGVLMFEVTILQGEVEPIEMVLRGANPDTRVLEPYDVSAATSITINAGKPGAESLIISAKDLTKVTDGADGQVSYTPLAGETAVAGRYETLVVATFAGGIIRKFPGRLTIKDAIA